MRHGGWGELSTRIMILGTQDNLSDYTIFSRNLTPFGEQKLNMKNRAGGE